MLTTVTVDIGTTSVKLCLFGPAGTLLASDRVATPTVRDSWGEVYDLEELIGAVSGFVLGLDPSLRADVRRIAVTGVGESGGLVRPDLSLASPMILWHDQRGAGYLETLSGAARLRIYEVTGLPASPNYGLSKTAWALDHADGALQGAQWLNVAEYLAAVMTGWRWSEYSLASRTMALDLREGRWSAEICRLLGVDVDLFPELRSASVGTPIDQVFARRLGLSGAVLVHVAGHDHMVGAVGADLKSGELLNSTGTTEGLLMVRDSPKTSAKDAATQLANGISCRGGQFTLFASIPTGGSAFATLQSLVGVGGEELADMTLRVHEQYLAGSIDLSRIPLVLPQFRGSPPPSKDASARGVISGVGTDTTAEEVVFGCFLGMALQFSDVLDLFAARPDALKVIGPASRNPLWLQLKADLLGVPLAVSAFTEVVSLGAQLLASGGMTAGGTTDASSSLSPDGPRHERLHEWRLTVQPRWAHLKATPS